MPWVQFSKRWDERPQPNIVRAHKAGDRAFVTKKEMARILKHEAGKEIPSPEDIKTDKSPARVKPKKAQG